MDVLLRYKCTKSVQVTLEWHINIAIYRIVRKHQTSKIFYKRFLSLTYISTHNISFADIHASTLYYLANLCVNTLYCSGQPVYQHPVFIWSAYISTHCFVLVSLYFNTLYSSGPPICQHTVFIWLAYMLTHCFVLVHRYVNTLYYLVSLYVNTPFYLISLAFNTLYLSDQPICQHTVFIWSAYMLTHCIYLANFDVTKLCLSGQHLCQHTVFIWPTSMPTYCIYLANFDVNTLCLSG